MWGSLTLAPMTLHTAKARPSYSSVSRIRRFCIHRFLQKKLVVWVGSVHVINTHHIPVKQKINLVWPKHALCTGVHSNRRLGGGGGGGGGTFAAKYRGVQRPQNSCPPVPPLIKWISMDELLIAVVVAYTCTAGSAHPSMIIKKP